MRLHHCVTAVVLSVALAAPALSQFRVPRVVQRVIPGRAQPQPVVVGIDALRADFKLKSGSDLVYFAGSTTGLSPNTRQVLSAQAAWLRQHPEVAVRIEGHADLGDTRDHALAVGARRAIEVRDYLILLGVPAAQLTAVSWGKERAAVAGTSLQALAQSRRVQTVLVR
jgi:peptidoglycan-associated lipoprotein